jgi:hypothetical protein
MDRLSYREVFPRRHTFLPVIHVADQYQATGNARIAQGCGADGVFLISHRYCTYLTLIGVYDIVRQACPGFWVGLNFLDLEPVQAIEQVPPFASGLWADDWGIKEPYQPEVPRQLWEKRNAERNDWPGLCFGGVAFKYQGLVSDVGSAAQEAAKYMDVVTTSGDATGAAPMPLKVAAMRQGAPDAPLAIASGIDERNVRSFLEIADCFLVATGISRTFYHLNPEKTERLAKIIHGEQ